MNHIELKRDRTLQWSCLSDDVILWVRILQESLLAGPEFTIVDVWHLNETHSVLITNRVEDLPNWFSFTPEEVSRSAAVVLSKMKGSRPPSQEPLEGPNIWRVITGDRLVWTGKSEKDRQTDNGIVQIVTFASHALVAGGPLDIIDGFPTFGSFSGEDPPQDAQARAQIGFSAAKLLGIPRSVAAGSEWRFGQ